MDIFYTPSVILGPLRLLLFIMFIYGLSVLVVDKVSMRRGIDYFMLRYPLFLSVLVITTLVLTQLNAYDIVVMLCIFLIILIFVFLDLDFKKSLTKQLAEIKKRIVLYLLIKKERRESYLGLKNFRKQRKSQKNVKPINHAHCRKLQIGIGISLALLAFASRYYFFHFDNYLLSDLWYDDMSIIKDLNNNNYFFHSGTMVGEMSLISFYGDITGINHASALISFGLIESALLAVSLFWFVNKITDQAIAPGLITALCFIFLYPLLPLNLNEVTAPKSVFTAFSMMLPYIIYAIKPKHTFVTSKTFFYHMMLLSLGIININLIMGIFFLPLTVLTAMLYHGRKYSEYTFNLLYSYLSALGITAVIYGIASWIQNYDLSLFIKSNLYSYKNYSYLPQLIIPVDTLINYIIIISSITCAVTLVLYARKKVLASLSMVVVLITCFLATKKLNLTFIDADVHNILLAPSLCIMIGLTVFIIYRAIPVVLPNWGKMLVVGMGVLLVFRYTDNGALLKIPKKTEVNEQIIRVYDQMGSELMPFSYTVVNNYKNSRLGEGNHFFTSYQDFNTTFLAQDSIFQLYRKDKAFLIENPEIIIPQSTFVFIYSKSTIENKRNALDAKEQQEALNTIEKLRARGRIINIYRKSSELQVIEIVNDPKSTKVKDLLI